MVRVSSKCTMSDEKSADDKPVTKIELWEEASETVPSGSGVLPPVSDATTSTPTAGLQVPEDGNKKVRKQRTPSPTGERAGKVGRLTTAVRNGCNGAQDRDAKGTRRAAGNRGGRNNIGNCQEHAGYLPGCLGKI